MIVFGSLVLRRGCYESSLDRRCCWASPVRSHESERALDDGGQLQHLSLLSIIVLGLFLLIFFINNNDWRSQRKISNNNNKSANIIAIQKRLIVVDNCNCSWMVVAFCKGCGAIWNHLILVWRKTNEPPTGLGCCRLSSLPAPWRESTHLSDFVQNHTFVWCARLDFQRRLCSYSVLCVSTLQ